MVARTLPRSAMPGFRVLVVWGFRSLRAYGLEIFLKSLQESFTGLLLRNFEIKLPNKETLLFTIRPEP